jgi:glycine/D-amino acid oxidase-like deaminating enzyme
VQVDYLIVGQGLAGTLLSWHFEQAGLSYVVVDNNDKRAASRVGVGIINPVTGRRYATSWLIETILPYAIKTYKEIGSFLNKELIVESSLLHYFPTLQMQEAFENRVLANDPWLYWQKENPYDFINPRYKIGAIAPVVIVYIERLLTEWKNYLLQKDKYIEAAIKPEKIILSPDKIKCENIEANKIIFCNGLEAQQYSYFKNLPFAPNKGEYLIIEAPSITTNHIIKTGSTLIPLGKNKFWLGSNYSWQYENDLPTAIFLQEQTNNLQAVIGHDFKLIEHNALLRPATLERRPFVGWHPQHQNIGILNGLGTKGCSLAPYFAQAFTQYIVNAAPIIPEAHIERFEKILSKNL